MFDNCHWGQQLKSSGEKPKMSNHPYDPATNQYRDNLGTKYQTPGGQPATAGTTVTTYKNGQPVQGTIQGGVFVPNKK